MDVRCFKFGLLVVTAWWTAAVALAGSNVVSQAEGEDARWAQHVAQTYQEYQSQQQATLHAIEQARQDAAATSAAAKRNAEETDTRLRRIEEALTTQHQRELATLQDAHRFTLLIVGAVAGVAFFGMLVFAIFLLRSLNRRVELVAPQSFGGARPLGPGYAAALGTGDTQLVMVNPAEQSNTRFLTALERLEKRIREMESPLAAPAPLAEAGPPPEPPVEAAVEPPAKDDKQARIALLLGKGQALLNLQQADTALACFDEVIALDPTMAEAFVKKGGALERLGRIDDAIDNYDRAIALDNSMTMAYLCKGGVFNRLERYGEALQCYEQALRTQENVRPG